MSRWGNNSRKGGRVRDDTVKHGLTSQRKAAERRENEQGRWKDGGCEQKERKR